MNPTPAAPVDDNLLLDVRGLTKTFPIHGRGFIRRQIAEVRAVDELSFTLRRGETLGIVGESGSGKTTAARCMLRALAPTSGEVWFNSRAGWVDLAACTPQALKPLRREMQMIFQDPFSSLNPRMTVGQILAEPLVIHGIGKGSERDARVEAILRRVGLKPEHCGRYPHAFSGGQRQRIGIARALIMNPTLVVADEAVSALDVSVQAQVLNLLQDLRDEFNLSYVFVAHNLDVVRHFCQHVAVMYAGRVVEMAPAGELFSSPRHPYTRALLAAMPRADPDMPLRFDLDGEIADPARLPSGCAFHPRCPDCVASCRQERPLLHVTGSRRAVACHLDFTEGTREADKAASAILPSRPCALPLRVGLVGISGYGRWHLRMIEAQQRLARVQLVAAVVQNPAVEADACARLRTQGVGLFEDFRSMLDHARGRLDLVMVPTGIHWHAPMVIAALEAGVHVLVEKPLASTLGEVDRIEEAQRAAGRLVAVGFQELYVDLTHDVKRRLLAGEIGTVREVTVLGRWPRPLSYYSRNEWAGRVRVGNAWVLDSPVSNAFAHFLMLGLFWAGTAPESAAGIEHLQAELYRAQSIETFDTVSMVVLTTSGINLSFNGSHSGEVTLPPEIRIRGDRGDLVWVMGSHCRLRREGSPDHVWDLSVGEDSRMQMLDRVVQRLAGGSDFVVGTALARRHTELIARLQSYAPARQIPVTALVQTVREGETYVVVPGLDAALLRASEQGVLLSRAGLPWDVRGPGA